MALGDAAVVAALGQEGVEGKTHEEEDDDGAKGAANVRAKKGGVVIDGLRIRLEKGQDNNRYHNIQ